VVEEGLGVLRSGRPKRIHAEDFYDLYDGDLDLVSINRALHRSERVYNTIRPHRSLGKRTPAEYPDHCHPWAAPKTQLSHMS
jgi:hypothetical protein